MQTIRRSVEHPDTIIDVTYSIQPCSGAIHEITCEFIYAAPGATRKNWNEKSKSSSNVATGPQTETARPKYPVTKTAKPRSTAPMRNHHTNLYDRIWTVIKVKRPIAEPWQVWRTNGNKDCANSSNECKSLREFQCIRDCYDCSQLDR